MQRSSPIPTVGVKSLELVHSTEGAGSYQPRPTAWVLSAKWTQGLKARSIRVVSRKWFGLSALQILFFLDPGRWPGLV
jgi:hypothetical protein